MKYFALLLILASGFSSYGETSLDNWHVVKTQSGGLRVRVGPGLNKKIKATARNETPVRVIGESGDWLKVDHVPGVVCEEPKNPCFMHKNFLAKLDAEKAVRVVNLGRKVVAQDTVNRCVGCKTQNFNAEPKAPETRPESLPKAKPPVPTTAEPAPKALKLTCDPKEQPSLSAADQTRHRTGFLTASYDDCRKTCETDPNMESICRSFQYCQNNCSRSKMTGSRSVCKKDNECQKKNCSPFAFMETDEREEVLSAAIRHAVMDASKANPWVRMPALVENQEKLARGLVCLNLVRENLELEPMERNNSTCTTAFGIGQIIDGSFFDVFGMPKHVRAACGNLTLRQLQAGKCQMKGGVTNQANRFRIELFDAAPVTTNYMDMSPNQLYEMSAFDVDLQSRIMLGVWLNFYLQTRQWDRTWQRYFWGSPSASESASGAHHIRKINRCIGAVK